MFVRYDLDCRENDAAYSSSLPRERLYLLGTEKGNRYTQRDPQTHTSSISSGFVCIRWSVDVYTEPLPINGMRETVYWALSSSDSRDTHIERQRLIWGIYEVRCWGGLSYQNIEKYGKKAIPVTGRGGLTAGYWLLVAVLTVQFIPHRKHTPSP
jgi:hypothetical protein